MKKVLIFLIAVCFLIYYFFVLASDRIEINTASLEQLDEIIGIGPALGQRIIDGRPFSSVDDLLRVKGIGEKTLQKIKDQGLAYVKDSATAEVPIIEKTVAAETSQAPNSIPATTDVTQTPDTQPAEISAENSSRQAYPTGIILSEILPSPEGADEENEWIELYNTNNFEVDLSDWKIKDTTGTTTTFIIPKHLPAGRQAKISAYGYLIFKRPDTKITLNNTIDGLALYWPNEKIIDSMAYGKAPSNQSYNKIGANWPASNVSRSDAGWQWSASLTPGAKNIIVQNNAEKKTESLSKNEKFGNSGNSKEVDNSLAAIGQPTNNQENIRNANPWFLFLAALAMTVFSAIIVLFIKLKFNKNSS